MKIPEEIKSNKAIWDKIIDPMTAMAMTREWKAYTGLTDQISRETAAFSQRNIKFTKIMRPDWFQGMRDCMIMSKLEQLLPYSNLALRQHRHMHGASPAPAYFFHEINEKDGNGVRLEYSYVENGIQVAGMVPVWRMEDIPPSKREGIVIYKNTTHDRTHHLLCGFCGNSTGFEPGRSPRVYRKVSSHGVQNSVSFCERDLCIKLAAADYIWQRIMAVDNNSLLDLTGHQLLEHEMKGLFAKTEPKYPGEQILQQYIRTCIEEK